MEHEAWFGVELRHLAALVAIDQERSFRGAADRLGYVQSAVSRQIAVLEHLVGERLVERTRGHAHVELTRPGELLVGHAREILAGLEAARAKMYADEAEAAEVVRFAAARNLSARLLPGALAELRRGSDGPVPRIEVEDGLDDRQLFAQVKAGRIHVGCAEFPLEGGPFRARVVLNDPTVLVVPAGHKLTTVGRAPSLADLSGLDLIGHADWRMAALILAELAAAGHPRRPSVTVATNEGIVEAVAAGLGAALLPRLAVKPDDPRIAVISVDHLLPSRRIAVFWHPHRDGSPGVAQVVRAVVQWCRWHARTDRDGDPGTKPGAPAAEVDDGARASASAGAA